MRVKLLFINIIMVCLLITAIFSGYYMWAGYPDARGVLRQAVEQDAETVADFITTNILERGNGAFTKDALHGAFMDNIHSLDTAYQLQKLRLFLPSGKIIYSSDFDEIGKASHEMTGIGASTDVVFENHEYIQERLEHDEAVEKKHILTLMVPVKNDGVYVGAFELFFDISPMRNSLDRYFFTAAILFSSTTSVCVLLFISILCQLWQRQKKPQ